MSGQNTVANLNQALAFSPLYAGARPAETVFWPGCAAMKLAPALLLKTFRALQMEIPALGFSSWCCAKPTFAVGSEKQQAKRQGQLAAHFAAGGIKRVYTLCPNCRLTLQRQPQIEVLPAWPLLAQFARQNAGEGTAFQGRYILHDPCAARADAASQKAARAILRAKGVAFAEFEHCGPKTHCCGRKDMLFLTDAAASQKMLQSRLGEAGGLPIVTYCESCVEAFRAAGHSAVHLLEVLFDMPVKRGATNRVRNAHRKEYHA